MNRKRVVIAGLGDSGLLTAIRLAPDHDVVGISAKPGLVSGQELGMRLARPDEWARDYCVPFAKFRALDPVRTVHATLTGLDLSARQVLIQLPDGTPGVESFDALVIATGVANGFWRTPNLESHNEIDAGLRTTHKRLAEAESIAVIGGGAAAVSAAVNMAVAWPRTGIDLYFPGQHALVGHHPRVWTKIRRRLLAAGVGLHPGHRAILPDAGCAEITAGPISWRTGQSPIGAAAVLWAVGQVRPNTGWLPPELLDEDGFVRVTPELMLPGHPEVFAIGDVASTDPLRSSARNRADGLLARNIRAGFAGTPLRRYRPATRRWGSVLGAQSDGLQVFTPNGRTVRFPTWSVDRILQPWIVRRGIYHGIRE